MGSEAIFRRGHVVTLAPSPFHYDYKVGSIYILPHKRAAAKLRLVIGWRRTHALYSLILLFYLDHGCTVVMPPVLCPHEAKNREPIKITLDGQSTALAVSIRAETNREPWYDGS